MHQIIHMLVLLTHHLQQLGSWRRGVRDAPGTGERITASTVSDYHLSVLSTISSSWGVGGGVSGTPLGLEKGKLHQQCQTITSQCYLPSPAAGELEEGCQGRPWDWRKENCINSVRLSPLSAIYHLQQLGSWRRGVRDAPGTGERKTASTVSDYHLSVLSTISSSWGVGGGCQGCPWDWRKENCINSVRLSPLSAIYHLQQLGSWRRCVRDAPGTGERKTASTVSDYHLSVLSTISSSWTGERKIA